MGFDIDLEWDAPDPDPVGRSRRVADALLRCVPGLTEFPLDPEQIAEVLKVPVAEIWDRWSHVELHAPEAISGARVELWGMSGTVVLASNPVGGCEAALAAVGPLLAVLASNGLRVVNPDGLLAEYEAQRSRVLRAAEMIGGRA